MAVVATLQWMPTPPMLPSASPYDILRAARWRSALLTTFSLSLGFFEAVPLHALRNAGTLDVGILADLAGYQASLAEAGAADVGRTYDLIPLKIPGGCFHPKIMMLDGAWPAPIWWPGFEVSASSVVGLPPFGGPGLKLVHRRS